MFRVVICSVGLTAFACFILMKFGVHQGVSSVSITLPQPLLDKLNLLTSGVIPSSSASGGASSSSSSKDTKRCIDESGGFYDDYSNNEWKIKLDAMNRLLPRQETNATDKFPHGHAFYASIYHPTWSCDVTERVGVMVDGGKFVCDPHRISKDCLVYSIGSNNDWSFEQSVRKLMKCEIHTFDHTITPINKPNYIQFHKIGLGPHNSTNESMPSLLTMIDQLGHHDRPIDILKVDCEGCEVEAILPLLKKRSWRKNPPIRQLLIEFHWHRDQDLELLRAAADMGYVIFSKEANPYGRCCYEFSLLQLYLNETQLGKAVATTEVKRPSGLLSHRNFRGTL
eukprot:Platyproteum_vivax@DN694_c0_g1_i1.p1